MSMIRHILAAVVLLAHVAHGQTPDFLSIRTLAEATVGPYVGNVFAGSLLIALHDSVAVSEGFGPTESSHRYPMTSRTLFNVASITKSFTAVGILKLQDQGRLRVSDRIGKFIAGVPPDKREITVHQLLTHTSGLQQHYVAFEVGTRDSAVTNILRDTLAFTPGTGFRYSNENFELLAALIEIISGKTYEDFMRNTILAPNEMRDTHFWGEIDDLDARAVAQKLKPLSAKNRQRNWDQLGSGGIYTTPSDLFKLYRALERGTILKPATVELMLEPHAKASSTDVGYGWFISTTEWKTREYWTRGTEDFGHNAVLRWFPDDGVVIIVCANTGEIAGKESTANRMVSDALVRAIFSNKMTSH